MSLIKWRSPYIWDPFGDLTGLQYEMNRLFNASLGRSPRKGQEITESAWAPAVDVYNNKDNLVIKADLPGMTQKEIDVSVEDGVLKIRGEKKKEEEVKENNYYRFERAYGSFERSFSLPTNVDATKIKAAYKDGVLQLTLPKKEETKPKQIKVDIA
jgi:HSP20 family protein